MPADCLIVTSDELQTDESNITGESDYLKKAAIGASDKPDPILLSDS